MNNAQILKYQLRLAKLKERLQSAKEEENRKFNNLGWGVANRRSKINISFSKSDKIQMQIEHLENLINNLNS